MAWFQGEDNREFRWEASPVRVARAGWAPYSLNLGITQELSNFWQIRAGATAKPTEKITLGAKVAYFEIDEAFETPVLFFYPAWTRPNDKELGWTTFLMAKYQYSADLSLALVWEHLFVGDGLEQGHFFARNGLELVAGTDNDDADYIHFDLQLKF